MAADYRHAAVEAVVAEFTDAHCADDCENSANGILHAIRTAVASGRLSAEAVGAAVGVRIEMSRGDECGQYGASACEARLVPAGGSDGR